jgi:hypothetical protein
MTEAGAELAIDDSAADLEQEIGAAAGPAHLRRFVGRVRKLVGIVEGAISWA